MANKTPAPPPAPDPSKSYRDQVATDFEFAPKFAEQEAALRAQYDPQFARQQLDMLKQYGPEAATFYKQLLEQQDPESASLRRSLAAEVSSDLAAGGKLTAGERRESQQAIRGAQAARGNFLGAAPVTAEATAGAATSYAKRQSSLDRAQGFLSGVPTGTQQLAGAAGAVAGASTPQRGFNYVDRQAGVQGQNFALSNYSNQIAGYNAQIKANAANNPWTQALNLATGAVKLGGAIAGGPIGAGVGALASLYSPGSSLGGNY